MIYCLWLIILFNIGLGWFLMVFVFYFIKNSIRNKEKFIKTFVRDKALEEFGKDDPLAKAIEALDLVDEIGPILDLRLNQITQQIASQIPMGEFLLAGSLGQKMKLKIREEVFKMLPELKKHFVQRISKDFDIRQLIQEKIDGYDFDGLMQEIEKAGSRDYLKLKIFGALIGAAIGLIEVCLFFWLSQS